MPHCTPPLATLLHFVHNSTTFDLIDIFSECEQLERINIFIQKLDPSFVIILIGLLLNFFIGIKSGETNQVKKMCSLRKIGLHADVCSWDSMRHENLHLF